MEPYSWLYSCLGCAALEWNDPIWAAPWQNQQCGCAPSKDLDQPGHPPSLIRVFAVHMKKAWVLSYPMSAQRRLWSDWADAQADLSLRWAHTHFVGFVMSWLISICLLYHFFLLFFLLGFYGPSQLFNFFWAGGGGGGWNGRSSRKTTCPPASRFWHVRAGLKPTVLSWRLIRSTKD